MALGFAAILTLGAPAAAHDISQDWAYANPSDRAHWCHHLRVAYWAESVELTSTKTRLALAKIKLLRARHERPSKETKNYLERLVIAIEREAQHHEDILLVLSATATAKALGCQPWP